MSNIFAVEIFYGEFNEQTWQEATIEVANISHLHRWHDVHNGVYRIQCIQIHKVHIIPKIHKEHKEHCACTKDTFHYNKQMHDVHIAIRCSYFRY